MVMKYQIKDDESGLIIGECTAISNLASQPTMNEVGEAFYKITLIGFEVSKEFKKYSLQTKSYVNNIYLIFVNVKGEPIASIYFVINQPMFSHKSVFISGNKNIELTGTMDQHISSTTITLLKEWTEIPPTEINKWTSLSKPQLEDWLHAVRLYQQYRNYNKHKSNKRCYVLDGSFINDFNSFFCALGEAIYGPAGYFGFNISSLKDCLSEKRKEHGFSIVWINYINPVQQNNEKLQFIKFNEILELITSYQIPVTFLGGAV